MRLSLKGFVFKKDVLVSFRLLTLGLLFITASCSGGRRIDAESKDMASDSSSSPAPEAGSETAGRLRVMSYNVLKYGKDCQGPDDVMHGYLRTIIHYAAPDIIGLVKVATIKSSASDDAGDAVPGFAEAVRDKVLNAGAPGRYAVCPVTNRAAGNNVNLLFYDQQKLGYAGMQALVSNETDFNLFRLYLRSSVSNGGHDTAFLYFILNHTASGDKSKERDAQMAAVVQALHKRFSTLPDLIEMGDYNLRNTAEPGYQSLVSGDAGFRFADPPFALDHALSYPADWESDPEPYARFLTTSTRKNEGEPNDCGTGGAAKFWFDHILLSPSIAAGKGHFSYVPKSFRVVGNDGGRIGHSVNAGKHPNTAVPAAVAEALFQFSNKYPVMLELSVR